MVYEAKDSMRRRNKLRYQLFRNINGKVKMVDYARRSLNDGISVVKSKSKYLEAV